uniref:Cation/H+ exchanger domain-containing protein n=1 Tax=Coccolithus braarudii TaxID=221442 RepID=A0A7S0Q0V0_9EUKA
MLGLRELGVTYSPRLEPMLSCIIAGFVVCNPFGQRKQLSSLLEASMPPVLCFFFFTTGVGMHLGVLLHTWPLTLGLFSVRLFALAGGSCIGCYLAGAPSHYRVYGWLAYVTQAGMSLGLAGEVAENFPSWGPKLEMTLVSVIVLNQLVGPPLLEFALRRAGEDGCGVISAELEEERELSPSSNDAERVGFGGTRSVVSFQEVDLDSPAVLGSDGRGSRERSRVSAMTALIERAKREEAKTPI